MSRGVARRACQRIANRQRKKAQNKNVSPKKMTACPICYREDNLIDFECSHCVCEDCLMRMFEHAHQKCAVCRKFAIIKRKTPDREKRRKAKRLKLETKFKKEQAVLVESSTQASDPLDA